MPAGWSAPQRSLEIQYVDRNDPPDAINGNTIPTVFDDSLWTAGGFQLNFFQQPNVEQITIPDGSGGNISAINAFIVGSADLTAVPEPSTTFALLAVGTLLIGRRRRDAPAEERTRAFSGRTRPNSR